VRIFADWEILKLFTWDETKSENPPNNATNPIELFAASARLQMKELMDMTAEILMEKVNPDNAPEIIILCKKYGNDQLRKKAFNELKKDYTDDE
jgi:hypothetical protein